MADTIGYKEIELMITRAAEKIRTSCDELSGMDAATGDGDHGTTIVRAMDIAEDIVKKGKDNELKTLLTDVGWGVMGIDGGATGPLLGSFFMGLSMGMEDEKNIDNKTLAQMFQGGLAGVQKRSKAKVGDKTMMDALIPAVKALSTAVENKASIKHALKSAALAAVKGADSTKDFKARFGRAKNLGERTIGHKDPGAVSMSLIFQGFYEAIP